MANMKGGGKLKNIKVDIEKIKTLRKNANISIEKMSETLGYDSLNGYYYLETGRIKFPAEKLAMVAKVLGVPYDSLFFEDEFAEMAKK